MQGESEFTFGGALKGWRIVERNDPNPNHNHNHNPNPNPNPNPNQVERNAAIAVPTLVLAGEFDTMSVECHQQARPYTSIYRLTGP